MPYVTLRYVTLRYVTTPYPTLPLPNFLANIFHALGHFDINLECTVILHQWQIVELWREQRVHYFAWLWLQLASQGCHCLAGAAVDTNQANTAADERSPPMGGTCFFLGVWPWRLLVLVLLAHTTRTPTLHHNKPMSVACTAFAWRFVNGGGAFARCNKGVFPRVLLQKSSSLLTPNRTYQTRCEARLRQPGHRDASPQAISRLRLGSWLTTYKARPKGQIWKTKFWGSVFDGLFPPWLRYPKNAHDVKYCFEDFFRQGNGQQACTLSGQSSLPLRVVGLKGAVWWLAMALRLGQGSGKALWSSVSWPRTRDPLQCSSTLLTLVLSILLLTTQRVVTSVQHQAAPLPQLSHSVDGWWLRPQVCASTMMLTWTCKSADRLHRGIVGSLQNMSIDCCDMHFETNACAKEMKQPTKDSWTRL